MLGRKWNVIRACKGRISDLVRFGALLLALGAEYDRVPAGIGLGLRGDGAGEVQDLGRSVYGRMSDQFDKSCIGTGIGEEDRKAYTEISLELVDVLVSRLEEMVADQMSDPLSSSSFIASEVTIKDRVAGITAKGESGIFTMTVYTSSYKHTHMLIQTHTLAHSYTHSLSHSYTLIYTLTLTLIHTHIHTHSHTHTHSYTHSLSHSYTHKHNHSHTLSQVGVH
jgi:hypothetical protein